MHAHDTVADDEIILKRIPPGMDYVKAREGSGFRATSFALKPRPKEEFPSYSRQCTTSPNQLLDFEANKGRNMTGWRVAAITVANVRALGLDVRADPTDEDPGHCLIVPTEEQGFAERIWSKLAKKAPIVTTPDSKSEYS